MLKIDCKHVSSLSSERENGGGK